MRDLVLASVYKSFGEKQVLRDFSATFPQGQCTCIMGPSGCGKTTLMRILLGLTPMDAGTIEGLPPQKSAVFQENRLFEAFSPVSNVLAVLPGGRKENRRAVCSHLETLGLGDSLSVPVRALSGGMKRRVAIARAVLAPGELLILDEPFTGLDQTTKAQVMAWVSQHSGGKTTLLVTHDRREQAALARFCLEMQPLSED